MIVESLLLGALIIPVVGVIFGILVAMAYGAWFVFELALSLWAVVSVRIARRDRTPRA